MLCSSGMALIGLCRSFSSWVRLYAGVNKVPHLGCRFRSRHEAWSASGTKIYQTLRNDPFIKLSISLCVIVLGGTLALELNNKFRKKSSRVIGLLPPTFAHHAVKRVSLLKQLEDQLQDLRRRSSGGCPVLYVSGPAGSGKTQLLRQFCDEYLRLHQYTWMGLKQLSPVVLYLDATSNLTMASCLTEAVKEMGLGNPLAPENNISAIMSSLALQQVPWLLVVDNVTEETKNKACFTQLAEHISALNEAGGVSDGTVLMAGQGLPVAKESMAMPRG